MSGSDFRINFRTIFAFILHFHALICTIVCAFISLLVCLSSHFIPLICASSFAVLSRICAFVCAYFCLFPHLVSHLFRLSSRFCTFLCAYFRLFARLVSLLFAHLFHLFALIFTCSRAQFYFNFSFLHYDVLCLHLHFTLTYDSPLHIHFLTYTSLLETFICYIVVFRSTGRLSDCRNLPTPQFGYPLLPLRFHPDHLHI